ncbi:MAG: hypothetical protein E6I27_14920, partial [Chloroflexi bacterium]
MPEAPVNLVRDLAAQRSYGFGLGVADGQAMCNVSGGSATESHLGDCDSVERNVELAVAAAVETMTF